MGSGRSSEDERPHSGGKDSLYQRLILRKVPVELEEAWRIHRLGITLTLEDYEERLPGIIRDDLLLLKDAIDEIREDEREKAGQK